jgi:hypothetical protein
LERRRDALLKGKEVGCFFISQGIFVFGFPFFNSEKNLVP